MAVIETWFHQDLQEPVKVNYLNGNLFSNNGNGNRIGIVLTNNGENLSSISGTVSGYVVTADGSTVPCTGSKSGNRASILIPAAAYQPGSIFITVFVTDGTTVTTIGAVCTTVMRSRTNAQVDPGSTVTDWTQTINAAMQSVETAAANLGGIVAVPYASITFPVPLGKYTYYNNNLYRCITPIASSESFTAAHWIQVRLGDDVSDLKSAIEYTGTLLNKEVNVAPLVTWEKKIVTATDPDFVTNNSTKAITAGLFTLPIKQDAVVYFHSDSSKKTGVLFARYTSEGTLIDVENTASTKEGRYPINVGNQIGICIYSDVVIDKSILDEITITIKQASKEQDNAIRAIAKEKNDIGILDWFYYKGFNNNGKYEKTPYVAMSKPYYALYDLKVLIQNKNKTNLYGSSIGTYTDATGETQDKTLQPYTYTSDIQAIVQSGSYFYALLQTRYITSGLNEILDAFKINLMFNNGFPFFEYSYGAIQDDGRVTKSSSRYMTSSVFEGNGKTYRFEVASGYDYGIMLLDDNMNVTNQKAWDGSSAVIKLFRGNKYRICFGKATSGDITLQDTQSLTMTEVSDSGTGDEPSALAGTNIHFNTPVNCAKQNVTSDTLSVQDSVSTYNDPSVLMLPDTYTDNGTPTRLVICCHGAGGTVTTDDSQTEQNKACQYLVANGYAVLDTNGLPLDYADENGISKLNNVGSWLAMECYVKAYHYVMEHYNLRKDGVFVQGASMGGITSTNLVMGGQLPVIAHGALCPVLDTYNQIWLHPWGSGLPKTALAKLFDFEIVDGQYVYSEEKVTGYNPVNNHTVTVDGTKYTYYPCPVKFWHCDNDNVVNPEISRTFIQQIKNQGGRAYMRRLPSGGHEPQDAGNVLVNPTGNTNYRGTTLQVRPVMDELLIWFNRYN